MGCADQVDGAMRLGTLRGGSAKTFALGTGVQRSGCRLKRKPVRVQRVDGATRPASLAISVVRHVQAVDLAPLSPVSCRARRAVLRGAGGEELASPQSSSAVRAVKGGTQLRRAHARGTRSARLAKRANFPLQWEGRVQTFV